MPKINHEILTWARETAGLTPEQAVEKLGINDAHGIDAVSRLHDLENGKTEPSRAVLVKMAKCYRRSLLIFYLAAAPQKGDRGEDFRTSSASATDETNALVDTLIRDIKIRQNLVKSLLEDDDGSKALNFIGSVKITDGKNKIARAIADTIQFDRDKFRKKRTSQEAFAYLRHTVESAGIYVLLIGNLGTHHTNINVKNFRGFALADTTAPFVVINDQDSPSAWAFTLLHELTHLWLGQTGISGAISENRIEKFCNEVASEFLLPSVDFESFKIDLKADFNHIVDAIGLYATANNVSRSMVTYKLMESGMIEFTMWQKLTEHFYSQWLKNKEVQKNKSKESEGGPNYYVVKRQRLGAALVDIVKRSINDGTLTPTKASKVLGVKPRSVMNLIAEPKLRGV